MSEPEITSHPEISANLDDCWLKSPGHTPTFQAFLDSLDTKEVRHCQRKDISHTNFASPRKRAWRY